MKIPLIHSNGTSKQSLLDGLENAYDALQKAYKALKETAPNGRDYDDLRPAREEHRDRLRKVQEVADEIETMMEKISEQ